MPSFHLGNLSRLLFGFSFAPLDIEDFHGSGVYVRRYYLLCLAYALHYGMTDWYPVVPSDQRSQVPSSEECTQSFTRLLRQSYVMLVNLPHYADLVLEQYQQIVEQLGEWRDVFSCDPREALEEAHNWLSDAERRKIWKQRANGIVASLPVDFERVEAYAQEAVKEYEGLTRGIHLAEVVDPSTDNLDGSRPVAVVEYKYADRLEFTVLSAAQRPQVDYQIARSIAEQEILHVVSKIRANEAVGTCHVPQLSFAVIEKAVRRMISHGCKPDILLIPYGRVAAAWRADARFAEQLVYLDQDRFLQSNYSAS